MIGRLAEDGDDEELIDEDLKVPPKPVRSIMPIERLMSEANEDDS